MRLDNYLFEVLDTNIEIKPIPKSNSYIAKEFNAIGNFGSALFYRFSVDDIEYEFMAYKVPKLHLVLLDMEDYNDVWEMIMFALPNPRIKKQGWEIINSGRFAGVVLSGVKKCILDVLKKKDPKYIIIAAIEKSRKKFYERIATKIAPRYGYHIIKKERLPSITSGMNTTWVLEKK